MVCVVCSVYVWHASSSGCECAHVRWDTPRGSLTCILESTVLTTIRSNSNYIPTRFNILKRIVALTLSLLQLKFRQLLRIIYTLPRRRRHYFKLTFLRLTHQLLSSDLHRGRPLILDLEDGRTGGGRGGDKMSTPAYK